MFYVLRYRLGLHKTIYHHWPNSCIRIYAPCTCFNCFNLLLTVTSLLSMTLSSMSMTTQILTQEIRPFRRMGFYLFRLWVFDSINAYIRRFESIQTKNGTEEGTIFVSDLKTDDQIFKEVGFQWENDDINQCDFNPHGLSTWTEPDGKELIFSSTKPIYNLEINYSGSTLLFVITPRINKNVVDIFRWDDITSTLIHVQRIRNESSFHS
jgi:hypothetical protein